MKPWTLAAYGAFFVDVDGVLVHDTQPIAGATEAFRLLQQSGHVVILTNNSTRSRVQHAQHLSSLGFELQSTDIVCSSYVIAEHLKKLAGAVQVWPIGEQGLRDELVISGHHLATDPHFAQWIATGMDRRFDYTKMAQGLHALLAGAQWAATNEDGTYPIPGGLMPGAGAIVGALRGMGFEPDVTVGKPNAPIFDIAKSLVSTDKILMIGDRLGTDILGGIQNGIDTLFVLSGISNQSDMQTEGIQSTWIAKSLASVLSGDIRRL
ncbi:HAD-IIA family hydrolase [Candidatus Bipolaricaulota bacterium]|nr:HAD-IIA family hydrolase [Candidatus Bipolaricaulota bacterium]